MVAKIENYQGSNQICVSFKNESYESDAWRQAQSAASVFFWNGYKGG
jgi:hypothetical protein